VGAYNILRKYREENNIDIETDPMHIKTPFILKVAV